VRLWNNPEKYEHEEAFRELYNKHGEILDGVKRRYLGMLFDAPEQFLEGNVYMKIGCMRAECPIRKSLLRVVLPLHVQKDVPDMDAQVKRLVEVANKFTILKLCLRCVVKL